MYIFFERMRSECIKFGASVGMERRANALWVPFVVIEFWHGFYTWSLERGKK